MNQGKGISVYMKFQRKNDLPIFGREIEDDWSWDRQEEELREQNESDEEQEKSN